jgi:hypothetical protein
MENIEQYLVIAGAVVLILALKIWTIRKRIGKQSEGFIDPAYCISHL